MAKKRRRLRKWVKVAIGCIAASVCAIGIASTFDAKTSNSEVATAAPAETASNSVLEISTVEPADTPKTTDIPEVTEMDNDTLQSIETAAEADEKARSEKELNENLPLGNRGRLYIGTWSVALNGSDDNNADELQQAADTADSASYVEYNRKVMIADHANQGFERIESLVVGDEITIKTEDGTKTYVCTALYPDSYYKDGYAMLPDGTDAWAENDGDIMLQTNSDEEGTKLFIAVFKEAESDGDE